VRAFGADSRSEAKARRQKRCELRREIGERKGEVPLGNSHRAAIK